MNKYLLIILLFAISNVVIAQSNDSIPNYIMANNSNLVVNFITNSTINLNSTTITKAEIKKINKKTDTTLNIFNELASVINTELSNLKINTNEFNIVEKEESVQSNAKLLEKRVGYFINIVIANWDSISNNLDVKNVFLSKFDIIRVNNEDTIIKYHLLEKTDSLKNVFSLLKNNIDNRDKKYFVKEMKIYQKYSDSEISDMIHKENKALYTFPNKKELKENPILIIVTDGFSDYLFKKTNDMLKAEYPYNFKLIRNKECEENIGNYNYVLLSRKYKTVRTTRVSRSTGSSTQKSKKVTVYYYLPKNTQTLNVYYSKKKTDLEKNASENQLYSLKYLLKVMKKYYKWN